MKPRRYASLAERIIANSVVSPDSFYNGTPCWLWIGKRRTNRVGMHYGAMTRRVNGQHKTEQAHRVAIKASGRKLRADQVGKHLCNETICVNWDHLAGGTQSTNMRQCYAEGRSNLCRQNDERREAVS